MARYRVGIETRERILDATRSLLGEGGLEGTTLKAICDRAGVLPGSFYNLFPSKDDAVLEVVREAILAVDPHSADEGRDTVDELVAAYVKFVTGTPTLARIYLQIAVGGGASGLFRRVYRHHKRRTERFARAIAADAGVGADESQFRAEALLAAMNGLAWQWLIDPAVDFVGHAARLAHQAVGAPSARRSGGSSRPR